MKFEDFSVGDVVQLNGSDIPQMTVVSINPTASFQVETKWFWTGEMRTGNFPPGSLTMIKKVKS